MEIENFGTLKLTLSLAISYMLAFITVGVVSHTFHLNNDYVPYVIFIEKCFYFV